MKKRFLFTAFFLIFVFAIFAQNNELTLNSNDLPSPYNPQVLKAFADSLYNEGFLSQAEGEYKRYLYSDVQDKEQALLALTNIYKTQGNTNGIEWLKNTHYSTASNLVKEKINFVQADFIFKTRDAVSFGIFTASFAKEKTLFSRNFANLIDASTLLLNNDIGGLKNLCSELVPINPDYEKLNELCQKYKLKSPGLALFLSTIIPGSGKWYTGSFGGFISSFLSIGSFTAGTILTGIQTEWKSWQPYVFGTCGIILYIADLYGAYQSAKRYNAALYRVL